MDSPLTVVVADDHPLFRKGVVEVLGADASIQLAGEAADGEVALRMIRELKPRIAVLDIEMPRMSGFDVARTAHEEGLSTGLVILTMHAGTDMLQQALAFGVRGYVSKVSAVDDIVACIHLVSVGRTYISASLGGTATVAVPGPAAALDELTRAERGVLRLIAAGKMTRDIAHELGTSAKTVEHHRSNICRKLGVTGNNALVRFAMERAAELRAL